GLVVFQFAISVVLIVSTIAVYNQLQYVQNKELGFDKEQILTITGTFPLQQKTLAFRDELARLPGVAAVSSCSALPGENFFGISFRKPEENETVFGSGLLIDEYFAECLGLEIVAGRDFSEDLNDTLSVVVNEAAIRELELEDPVGKRLLTTDAAVMREGETESRLEIVGVVRDFHFQSLHQPISPVFMVLNRNPDGSNANISLRIRGGEVQAVVTAAEQLWQRFAPDQPFSYSFLDGDLARLYESERLAQRLFGLFSLLAIFVACLGLLGLTAYMAQQRTKEIGIRKVLGASIPNIVKLLSSDLLRLVMISLVIALPLAWYLMNRWLENFAYSAGLKWWIFALAGLIALVTAFLTIGYHSVKAALSNPVKALKYE
ncbi:MAG: FtsX-like permease family protein, partial [Saprospiraceae bacterium]|nr:FtsX-like permease family protein [Saprospiraceae bacterium]